MGLDHVDTSGVEPRSFEGLADETLLSRSAGRSETVGGPILVDGAAADHSEHWVAFTQRVAEPLGNDNSDGLRPTGTVRVVREGLAAAVPG